ncbi:MAG: right-handed parallel beta-helix repeat-containing protein [Planctomycetota bacterium]
MRIWWIIPLLFIVVLFCPFADGEVIYMDDDTITATASLPRGSYTLGQPVPIEIVFTNHGQQPAYIKVDEFGFLRTNVIVEDVNGSRIYPLGVPSPPPPPRYWWITVDGKKIYTEPVVKIESGQTTKLMIQDALDLYHNQLQPGTYFLTPREQVVIHEVDAIIIREDQEHKLWIQPSAIISRARYETNKVEITLYQGKIIYVDDDGPSDFNTIQAAIDDANDGDTVVVAPGTYTGDGNRDIDFKVKAITVKSEDGPQTCIIDCQGTKDNPHRGFQVYSRNAVLDGFKVINGYAKDSGGGIYCADTSIIKNCIVTTNYSEDNGGGIFISDGTVLDCIITNNAAYHWGGGIYASSGNPVLVNCIITKNQAGSGGGISASHGDPVLLNCTIVRNKAWTAGGIFCRYRGMMTMTNCILVGNKASSGNQIVAVDSGIIISAMAIQIKNSCIQSDSCDDISREGCMPGWYGRGRSTIALLDDIIYTSDPCFVNPSIGDFRLHPDSPCIDAGTDATSIQLPAIDIDGNPRNVDGNRDGSTLPDIGACELPAPNQPYIWFSPPQLEFVAEFDGLNPAPQIFTIQNLGLRKLDWTIQYNSDWLDVFPDHRNYKPHTTRVGINIDSSSLQHGSYTCDIIISDPNALNHPQKIPVVLHVTKPLYVPTEFPTIQNAINASVPYDTIIVADGIYEGSGNHDITFRDKPITVRSENGPQNCIIDSRNRNDLGSVFVFNSEEDKRATLEGFTIIAGACREAILCDQSSLTIRNCQIVGDGDAIGIDLIWSDAIVENCFIESCHWAIHTYCSEAVISDCKVKNNYIGLILLGLSPQLYRCNISKNKGEAIEIASCRGTHIVECTVTHNGDDNRFIPAVICGGSSFVLKKCTVGGNNSAGLLIYDCPNAVVRNCIVSGNGKYNSSTGYGIRSMVSNIVVDNSTIAGNVGDGFRCEGNQAGRLPPGMNMLLKNSILWGNEPNQVGGNTDLLSMTHTNVQDGWPGEGNINADPCFTNPGYWADTYDPNIVVEPNDSNAVWIDGDYHLKSQAGRWDPHTQSLVQDDVTSPCIDAGDPNTPIGREPFPNGGIINMGAYGGTAEASKSIRP